LRALGIDPGTGTFDLAVVDGERVVHEDSLPAAEVAEDPERLVRAIEASRADVIAAPSGYGVPFAWASDVRDPLRFTYEVLLLSTREQIAKASGELGVKVYEALALVVSQLVKADVRASSCHPSYSSGQCQPTGSTTRSTWGRPTSWPQPS